MITIEDKIESFKKIIHEDIDSKFVIEIEKIEEETKEIVDKHQIERNQEIERLKRDYITKLESKKDKICSKAQKEGQDMMLSANKDIYEDFFKSLKEKIKNDYLTEVGEKYLIEAIKKAKDDIKENNIIYVFEQTYDRDKAIIQSIINNAQVQKSNNIKIGGFEVEDREKTYRNNYSLDLVVENKYKDILTRLKKEIGIIA